MSGLTDATGKRATHTGEIAVTRKYLTVFIFHFIAFFLGYSLQASASPTLELYGTFESMGVIVHLDAGSDPNWSAAASVEYRPSGGSYKSGFPLTRVADTRFVGSLFWLDPGTAYDVRVTLTNPQGGILNGVVLNSSAGTRAEISLPAPTQSLYAAPNGTGTDCTLGSPCDVQEAVLQAFPGDEVVLRGGVYYTGNILFMRGGTAQAPLVVRNYQGETPILDGADPQDFQWTPVGGGVYTTTLNAESPNTVGADGARLYPYGTLSDLQNLVWELPGMYVDGYNLYVHLSGDANPNASDMAASRYIYGFKSLKSHTVIHGLTFRHYGALGPYGTALTIEDADNVIVENCEFFMNHVGVVIAKNSSNTVIQECVFSDTVGDWSWDAWAASGSTVYTLLFSAQLEGRGNVVRRNIFHDAIDGLIVCPQNLNSITHETDVYENEIFRTVDDGMENDGQCSNVRIWNNEIHDVLYGISMAPAKTGPIYAIRNRIYRTGRIDKSDWPASSIKLGTNDHSGPIYLFHNTSDTGPSRPNRYGMYLSVPSSWDLIYARNNSWSATAYALRNVNPTMPADFDYNHYWNYSGGYLMNWTGYGYFYHVPPFATASGQELNGMDGDPSFTDAANADYSLRSDSHLIDAGVLIPGINDNFENSAPDIGALEFIGTPTAPASHDDAKKALVVLLNSLLMSEE